MSTERTFNSRNRHRIKTDGSMLVFPCLVFFLVGLCMSGCASVPSPSPEESVQKFIDEQTKGAVDGSSAANTDKQSTPRPAQLPVRFQKPSYNLGNSASYEAIENDFIPVGADYSPKGPMTLRSILSQLTNLKKFSISWASDVNKDVLVSVPNIRATEDFFKVIDNILRQYDYSYEVQAHTIIVKHKETKNFHIAMPFTASSYSTSVGGDVLGSTQGNNMSGTLNINSQNNAFDIWGNIQSNLDKILEIWAVPVAPVPTSEPQGLGTTSTQTAQTLTVPSAPPSGLGYYTIDKPIGLITITAPHSIIEKCESYLDNLKGELYRQVSIEAKIIEVTLTGDNTTGINWGDLLERTFDFTMDFAKTNIISSSATTPGAFLTIGTENFGVVLDAMKTQGHVEVLSNPKISVMNGQPAMISVGENVTYVDNISSTTDTNGVITYSINTASVMSGLGLGVIASIMNDNEVILSITPVTSDLTQPIEYLTVGANQVGLPKVNLREMNTIVRVKNGEMLIIGGLIDNSSTYSDDYVAGLGETKATGKLFKSDGTITEKKELIILMRPQIHSL